MRYQDWDVLLFPHDSRTPIQEFDTKCFVLDQYLGGSTDATLEKQRNTVESMTLLPILTSFVASLERGTPFRISIHSWSKPRPSQLLLSYKAQDEAALFEARVYFDGVLVSQRTFDDNVWPEVIDHRGQFLRFPKFHRDILDQPDWEPGELVGRIKVVLAEGVLRANTPPASSPARFDRLRDVVAFSFQHAPLDILEYSGIAWPNAKMFLDKQKRAPRSGLARSRISGIPGHEVHSHSPQRLPPIASRAKESSATETFHTAVASHTVSGKRPGLEELKNVSSKEHVSTKMVAQEDDPFVSSHQSPAMIQQWRSMLRSTSHDVSMADVASSRSAVHTEMSGVSIARVNFEKRVNDANPEEIADALSPLRRAQLLRLLSASNSPATERGTRAPTNTPRMSATPDETNTVTTDDQPVKDSALGKSHTQLWREPQGRPRTSSESTSARSTSEPVVDHHKENSSPRVFRESSVPVQGTHVLALAPRAQSMNINRKRSASSGSKRKRLSPTPSALVSSSIRLVAVTPPS